MSLKITLKPYERVIIAGAAVANGKTAVRLTIENNVPILRGKDILTEKNAASPARRIYYIIQLMYLDQVNLADHHRIYWDMVRTFVNAAPKSMKLIDTISEHVICARYYQALKLVRKLIGYEQAIISRTTEADKEP